MQQPGALPRKLEMRTAQSMTPNPTACKRCHYRAITDRINGVCTDCRDILMGVRSHRSKVIPCPVLDCHKRFPDFHSVTSHLANFDHNAIQPEKTIPCGDHCGKKFASTEARKTHLEMVA